MFCLQMNQGKLIDTSPHADGLHWQLANGASSPSGSLLRRNIHTVIFRVLCTESKSILRAYLSMHNLISIVWYLASPCMVFPQAFLVYSFRWPERHFLHGKVRAGSRASLCLLEWRGEKAALPESCQAFEVTAAQTSGQVNLVFPCQTGFFECKHLFIDKLMVINETAVAST